MLDKIKKTLGAIVPTLAHALGGPLAGTAVTTIAKALKVDGEEDVKKAIADKLDVATAEDWLALKEAEHEFELEMEKLDVSKEKIRQMDRDSARKMRVSMKDRFPDFLAVLILTAFGWTLYEVIMMANNRLELNPQMITVIDVMLGMLMAAVTAVVSFYFGSSKGSQRKTELMNGQQ